uniref:SDR family oxidoreductase n=1 Tax=Accipiter nisus TaxID=211598 RepID=A0A8B9NF90_9AVES
MGAGCRSVGSTSGRGWWWAWRGGALTGGRRQALGPYSVSKAALLGLVKALAPELRPRRIRLNAVAPGLVRTRFSAALWEDEATRERVMAAMGIDRLGTPSDVAEVVTFLCSPAAAYVVGETIVVAGGAPSRL